MPIATRGRRRHRRRICASLAGSLVLHAALYGAVAASVAYLPPLEAPSFAGSRTAIQIQATWSVEQPRAATIEVAVPASIEITPTTVQIEHQRLVLENVSIEQTQPAAEPVSAAQVPEVSYAAPPAVEVVPPVASRPTADVPPPAATSEIPLPTRRMATDPPASSASVAALPQPVGLDETIPPSFAGNRPPNYPLLAQQRGWQGTVLLRLVIGPTGEVETVTLARSSGYDVLDAEAIAAVRTWRGTPARRGGQPVATEELLPVRFRLR